MPSPSKFAVAAMVSFALAAASAGIVHFYVLTDSQDFHPTCRLRSRRSMIFGCLLSVSPKIAGIGLIMNIIFLVLLAPSNPQVVQPAHFLFRNACSWHFALGVVFLASRLVWPVSELDKQHAVVRATQETLAASVTGERIQPASAEYRAGLPDRRLCRVGYRQARRPHPEVLKGLLATNDLSLACGSASPSSGSRARTTRQSAPGLAHCNALFGPATAGDFTPAPDQFFDACAEGKPGCTRHFWRAATDLWSAGLVLERERRRIRHFADQGLIKKGEGRWS